jgi:iron(III) transport system substrate-binding protein
MKLPEGFPARDTIKVLPINAASALKNTDADLKTFSGIYGSN